MNKLKYASEFFFAEKQQLVDSRQEPHLVSFCHYILNMGTPVIPDLSAFGLDSERKAMQISV